MTNIADEIIVRQNLNIIIQRVTADQYPINTDQLTLPCPDCKTEDAITVSRNKTDTPKVFCCYDCATSFPDLEPTVIELRIHL